MNTGPDNLFIFPGPEQEEDLRPEQDPHSRGIIGDCGGCDLRDLRSIELPKGMRWEILDKLTLPPRKRKETATNTSPDTTPPSS
ncbi:hypothetical protein KKC44_02670 [Patescibacteria group bacterium]|nr:hypothetical protein [Patescibacteria group bacterium]MBU2259487.1 hypothetical protein [Patescibacteria group bacterium]